MYEITSCKSVYEIVRMPIPQKHVSTPSPSNLNSSEVHVVQVLLMMDVRVYVCVHNVWVSCVSAERLILNEFVSHAKDECCINEMDQPSNVTLPRIIEKNV